MKHVVASILILFALLFVGATVFAASDYANCKTSVAADTLYLRSGPGTNHSVVGVLSSGVALNVLGQSFDDKWLLVTDGTTIGWVNRSYVSPGCKDLPEFSGKTTVVPTPTLTPTPVPQPTDGGHHWPPADTGPHPKWCRIVVWDHYGNVDAAGSYLVPWYKGCIYSGD